MFESFDEKAGNGPQPSGWNDPSYRLGVIAAFVGALVVNEIRVDLGFPAFDRLTGAALAVAAGAGGLWYSWRVYKRMPVGTARLSWWFNMPQSGLEWLARVVGVAALVCLILSQPRWSAAVASQPLQFWLFPVGVALLTLYLYVKHRLDDSSDESTSSYNSPPGSDTTKRDDE